MTQTDTQESLSELWACFKLAHTPGLGMRGQKRLLDHYGSAESAAADASSWHTLRIAEQNVADNFRAEKWREDAEAEWDLASRERMRALPYCDSRYPRRLRQIVDPPLYLYFRGNPELLRSPCIALVGARSCSARGTSITASISRALSARGIAVVSGFAWGIDRAAHQSALAEQGSSIAVLGTGLDLVYPARNKELWRQLTASGLILTEFPPGTRPEPYNFPRRNRIISGLSLGVLVTEATENSGSLITASCALEQDREIFAVPGFPENPTFSGCNSLIKQGAVLTRTAEDILQEIEPMLWEFIPEGQEQSSPEPEGPSPTPAAEDPSLTEQERAVAGVLNRGEPVHIDSVTRSLCWSSGRTSTVLLELELKGVVRLERGMYYTLLR